MPAASRQAAIIVFRKLVRGLGLSKKAKEDVITELLCGYHRGGWTIGDERVLAWGKGTREEPCLAMELAVRAYRLARVLASLGVRVHHQ